MQYPGIMTEVLYFLDMKRELSLFRKSCKSLKDGSPETYSTYIFGYWFAWLDRHNLVGYSERGSETCSNKTTTVGKKRIRIYGWNSQWDYEGELDREGKPYGKGIAINVKDVSW